jgi:hypothetical protein
MSKYLGEVDWELWSDDNEEDDYQIEKLKSLSLQEKFMD